MKRPSPPYPMWFAYLFAILPLVTWWASGLFDLDEGFYGAVTAEMLRRGDFITPYYNGQPWFEKPILLYWLAAPFMKVFGIWIGPRIPSVLCTIALYVLCGKFAKRHMGEWQARHVVYCLGTSILVLALGRLMMTDALLNLALTGAFLSFWDHLNTPVTPDPKRRTSNLLTASFLGLGVLAKGPVALLLFTPIAALTYYQNPDLRLKFFKGFLPALLVLVGTISTWYIPCYLANRETFVQKFLIEQNLNRFTGGDAAHSLGLAGLPFYIPILLIAVIPWGYGGYLEICKKFRQMILTRFKDSTLIVRIAVSVATLLPPIQTIWSSSFILSELRKHWKLALSNSLNRYLFTWAATIFIFFTISSAKLPHYILPVVAPIALLAASSISTRERTNARNPQVVVGVAIILLFLISGLQTSWYVQSGQVEAHTIALRHPEIDTVFQLSRQQKELGTGTTNLQQTSLPSLVMILNKPITEFDDPKSIKPNSVVFTRAGRVKAEWGWTIQEKGRNYEVWRTQP